MLHFSLLPPLNKCHMSEPVMSSKLCLPPQTPKSDHTLPGVAMCLPVKSVIRPQERISLPGRVRLDFRIMRAWSRTYADKCG